MQNLAQFLQKRILVSKKSKAVKLRFKFDTIEIYSAQDTHGG